MSASIREVAHDVGVTKMAIIGRMKRTPGFYDKYTRKDPLHHNMVIINDAGVQYLKSLTYNTNYGAEHREQSKSERAKRNARSGMYSYQIALLKTKLEDYQHLLSERRGDLQASRDQIHQLNKQVDNAQKLELLNKEESHRKSQSYEARIADLNERLKKLPSHPANSSDEQTQPKKKGFFARLFH